MTEIGERPHVFVLDLADEWGIHPTDMVRELRRSEGFRPRAKGSEGGSEESAPAAPPAGVFYVVRPWPEVVPNRIMVGHTTRLSDRISTYRGSNPEARLEKAWECPAAFEAAAICVVEAASSHRVGREVFDVPDVAALIEKLDAWFGFFEPAEEPVWEDASETDP